MVLRLALTCVFAIFNIVINQRVVNTNSNCKGCIKNAWNHTIIYKTGGSLTLNDLFKGFQILEIVYILNSALYFLYHTRLGKML